MRRKKTKRHLITYRGSTGCNLCKLKAKDPCSILFTISGPTSSSTSTTSSANVLGMGGGGGVIISVFMRCLEIAGNGTDASSGRLSQSQSTTVMTGGGKNMILF